MKPNFIQIFRGEDSSLLQSFLETEGRKPFRGVFVLLIFTLVLQIFSIWNLELSGRDSPRVAGIAREMAVTSNYLIPRLNGENFLEYPPVGYWPMALTVSMSQKAVDFLAFLPMIFFGAGTVLLTYLIGKRLAEERIGLMAGFFLSTMPGFVSLHRHCLVDPVLLFFITLSLYSFLIVYQKSKRNFPLFTLFYLAMAGGFLTKGVIGVAIPAATVMVFLITRKDLKTIRKLLLTPGIFLFLLPIFLWAGSVWWLEGPGIFKEVIRQSFWRFLSPTADHAKPFTYYFIPTFSSPMPWSLLLLVLLWYQWNPVHSKEKLPFRSLLNFSFVWSVTIFIGLSIASAKRILYLAPIFPPFALLGAMGWDLIREKFHGVKRWEVRGLVFLFLISIGIHLLFITPSKNKQSLRPLFKAALSQEASGPVYLVNPSETLRGASFFYLGKRIPVLSLRDVLSGKLEDRSGTTLIIDTYLGGIQRDSDIQSKGYRPIFKLKIRKDWVCVYSNSP